MQSYIHEISELSIEKANALSHLSFSSIFPNSFKVNINLPTTDLEKRCQNLKSLKVHKLRNGEPISIHKTHTNPPVILRFTPTLFIKRQTISKKSLPGSFVSKTHRIMSNSHRCQIQHPVKRKIILMIIRTTPSACLNLS